MRHASGDGTFPPPVGDRPPTPPHAPELETPAAAAAERGLATEPTTAQPRRRAPLVVAGIVSLGVLAGAAVVVLTSKQEDEKPVVTTAEGTPTEPLTLEAPIPPAVPTRAQPATEPAATEPTPVDTNPTDAAVTEDRPVATTAERRKVTRSTTGTRANQPAVTKVAAPVEKSVETKPVETKPLDANALAAKYQSVGAQLKALEIAKGPEATADLRERYRFVNLAKAMATQQSRDEAAAILSKLATAIV